MNKIVGTIVVMYYFIACFSIFINAIENDRTTPSFDSNKQWYINTEITKQMIKDGQL